MARHQYFGTYQDGTGRRIEDGTITVYEAGTTTLATIYAAATGGSAISGSFVNSDTTGFFAFFIDIGDYGAGSKFKLVLTKNGYGNLTIDNVGIVGL